MDINLDNGEAISLWDMHDLSQNATNTWGTILHADGSQSVLDIEPLANDASEFWYSEASNQNYTTKWIVKIPAKKAVLEVSTDIKEQEIVSVLPFLNKYEGACKVSGTYEDKPVTGYCYVELLGKWMKNS